jgi:glycosyltransferase involved in cell wall biosynthesis
MENVNITHHMRRENSGLVHTTLELAEEEQRQGHGIRMLEPSGESPLMETFTGSPDVHCIHSQLHQSTYHDGIPKIMWMHGEPLGSVGNGVSMRAIVDLASSCEAFICMRKEEWPVWNAIRKTYLVNKGVDLNRYKIQDPKPEKLSGDPAILYYENWRGQRNPLLLCLAMQEIIKVFPKAKLHLYNCPGGKMFDTFQRLINHCRWYSFIDSLKGQEKDVVTLLNRADIVVSCLYPLYARGVEAFGCGKAFIGAGYKEDGYPYTCDLEPKSMAKAIIKCYEEYGKFDFRQWAVDKHNITDTAKQCIDIYQRYAS